MEFRKSNEADIQAIMAIIKQAQDYFKENGINQWQNNYPNPSIINRDIAQEHSHVLIKDGEIVATAAISFDGEPTYKVIEDGEWLTDNKYAVMHRVAVDNQYKGLGLSSEIIKKVEQLCAEHNIPSIRVDTHHENTAMQKSLLKNQFKYCGVIYVEGCQKRVAFEKVLG